MSITLTTIAMRMSIAGSMRASPYINDYALLRRVTAGSVDGTKVQWTAHPAPLHPSATALMSTRITPSYRRVDGPLSDNGMNVKSWCLYSAAALSALVAPALHADTFSSAYYDPKTNELVVTMVYRGTNPDHEFSVQWGTCEPLGDDQTRHQIVAEVLDRQWNDAAQQTFTKTLRFSLADMNCRPATVTLRSAPRFEYTLQIP
jgi:hypothetical protein